MSKFVVLHGAEYKAEIMLNLDLVCVIQKGEEGGTEIFQIGDPEPFFVSESFETLKGMFGEFVEG